MKRRLGCFSAAFLFAIPAIPTSAEAADPTPRAVDAQALDFAAFGHSGYSFCDAALLASVWHTSVWESKMRVGQLIRAHAENALEAELRAARAQALRDPQTKGCTFEEAGFRYTDAEKLAQLWHRTPAEAKAKAERKMTVAGGESDLRHLLYGSSGVPVFDPDGRTLCDALLLASYWKVSVEDTKARVAKMGERTPAKLKDEARAARAYAKQNPKKVSCVFEQTSITSKEIAALAKVWQMSIADAEAKVAAHVSTGGSEASLRAELPVTQP